MECDRATCHSLFSKPKWLFTASSYRMLTHFNNDSQGQDECTFSNEGHLGAKLEKATSLH